MGTHVAASPRAAVTPRKTEVGYLSLGKERYLRILAPPVTAYGQTVMGTPARSRGNEGARTQQARCLVAGPGTVSP